MPDMFKPYNDEKEAERILHDERCRQRRPVLELQSVEELKNRVVRVNRSDKYFYVSYIDKDGVYQEKKIKDHLTFINEKGLIYCVQNNRFGDLTQPTLPRIIDNTLINRVWIKRILSTMAPGQDAIHDLVERYNYLVEHRIVDADGHIKDADFDAFYAKYKLYDNGRVSATEAMLRVANVSKEVRNFVCRIEKPFFERETDNPNKNSFDFIRIRLSIPTTDIMPDRKEFIHRNLKEIANVALVKIQGTKSYKRYGIPINFLKLEKATITTDSQLELLFELKDMLQKEVDF